MSALADRPANPVVGHRAAHESAALHVTGAAMYTDDLAAHTAGVLTAWPVQSTNAHAKVTVDVSGAYEVPGVVRVLTAEDVPGINDAGIKHDEPLFPSEAMFYGHALVWVLGETQEAARLGAERVTVEYEPLPSLITVQDAIDAESYQGIARTVQRGDAASALASAAHVFEGVTEFGGQEHFYLETHASLAIRDSEGQYFVQCSTQHPSETQEIIAHVLGITSSEVTVQSLRMGGAFGGKEMQPHGLAAIAALGAKLTGRPVRLRLNRTQDITMTGKRHPFHISWKVGFDADGMLQGLDAVLTCDGGWSLDLSEPVLGREAVGPMVGRDEALRHELPPQVSGNCQHCASGRGAGERAGGAPVERAAVIGTGARAGRCGTSAGAGRHLDLLLFSEDSTNAVICPFRRSSHRSARSGYCGGCGSGCGVSSAGRVVVSAGSGSVSGWPVTGSSGVTASSGTTALTSVSSTLGSGGGGVAVSYSSPGSSRGALLGGGALSFGAAAPL